MSMPVCARCKKNMAVVFITKLENGKTVNEGLCLKCAKELGIKPVADLLDKFGLKDSDLDGLTPETPWETLRNVNATTFMPLPLFFLFFVVLPHGLPGGFHFL